VKILKLPNQSPYGALKWEHRGSVLAELGYQRRPLSDSTKKVIVNLAPANLRKEGPAFDLPIALGILAASGALPAGGLEGAGVVGELSLDGGLRGVRGALSMAEGARREGLARLLVPERDAPEAAAIGGVEVYGIRSLREAVEFLGDCVRVSPAEPVAEDERTGFPSCARP
jgi:predicted ATPase with chaperone activity